MKNRFDIERENEMKATYELFLFAIEKLNAEKKGSDIAFEMRPAKKEFDEIHSKKSTLQLELVSKKSGAVIKTERKFFPHCWVSRISKRCNKRRSFCFS